MRHNGLLKFFSLSFREQLLSLRAALLLQWYWVALKRSPYEELERRRRAASPPNRRSRGFSVEQIVETVRSVSWRFRWSDTCLIRSLAIASLLGRYGHAAELRIGARKEGGQALSVHAWIEDGQGNVLAEEVDDLERYSRFERG